MRTLRSLELTNWGPFRGTHCIKLRDVVYAVLAQDETDHDKSNAIGKSTFVMAIPMLLHGWHTWRVDDDWISRGADEGALVGTFDCGSRIEVKKVRGKSTRVKFVDSKGQELSGETAREEIVKRMGLDRQDFFDVAFFEQKKTDRLVKYRPRELMRVIASWCRLDQLEEADKIVSGELSKLRDERSKIAGTCDGIQVAIDAALQGIERKRLDAAIAKAAELYADARSRADRATSELSRIGEWRRHVENVDRLREIVSEGNKAAPFEKKLPKLTSAFSEADLLERSASEKLHEIERQVKASARLAAGKFDGACPLLEGLDCPKVTEINQARAQHKTALSNGEEAWGHAKTKLDALKDDASAKHIDLSEARRMVERLKLLRADRDRLLPSIDYIKKHGRPPSTDLESISRQANEAVIKHRSVHDLLVSTKGRVERLELELEQAQKALEQLDREIELRRAECLILGPDGAQRVVAESRTAHIVRMASDALAKASVDLSVSVRWERETSGLTNVCNACGAPFPKSAKVKECATCGAERGQGLERKPEFVLSDSSGAYDDLAGVALQLAAGSWLRRDRGSEWACAVLDEPLAHVDPYHRRAFSSHIVRMLADVAGMRQAFVIAHHASVLDSLPARIVITRARDGSLSLEAT